MICESQEYKKTTYYDPRKIATLKIDKHKVNFIWNDDTHIRGTYKFGLESKISEDDTNNNAQNCIIK